MATHNWLLLSTLKSPVSSLFMMLNVLFLPFSLIWPPHTHTLWWLLLQAGHMASGPLGDIFILCCMASGRQVSLSICAMCKTAGLSSPSLAVLRGGRQGSVCLWPPVLWG